MADPAPAPDPRRSRRWAQQLVLSPPAPHKGLPQDSWWTGDEATFAQRWPVERQRMQQSKFGQVERLDFDMEPGA